MAGKKTIRHMGISSAEDRKWHEAQGAAANKPDEATPEERSVNCFAIGGGFLDYCVKQGWLIRQKHGKATKYYVTEVGRKALADFGITKY
jgi:hypothetical protein